MNKIVRSIKQGGFAVLVRTPDQSVDPFSIFYPFTFRLWVLLFGTTFVMAFVFYIIDRITPYGFHYQDDENKRKQTSKKKKKNF